MPMIVTDLNQHDSPIMFGNDAFLRLT